MIPQTSLSSKTAAPSGTLTMPEPISFDFEDMIKAKAEADAEIRAEIERRLTERALGAGTGYKGVSDRGSTTENYAPESMSAVLYRYDIVGEHGVPSELDALKRRKNRK